MKDDIAPELLEQLQEEFQKNFKNNKKIKDLNKALSDNKKNISYKEANDFSKEVGQILASVYQKNLSSDILPDGKMYYNIATRIIDPTMKQNYDLISLYAQAVQTKINHKEGIRIKGIQAELNQDRIDGLVNKVSTAEVFDKELSNLKESVINFSQAIVDDTVKVNADFIYRAGLKPKIIRKETGNCCDWCKAVVGKYGYPDAPKDVFRRHRYCRCTVEYDPGNEKKQNVHNKKWIDPEKAGKIEERKRLFITQKEINRKEDSEQYKQYIDILGEERMPISVAAFQELKYNNPEEYEKLKDHVYIQSNFNSGKWLDKINLDKQRRHIKSTAEEGNSYFFDDVDIDELYKKHSQTSKFRRRRRGVNENNYELIDLDKDNDYGIDFYTGNAINGFTIHYSKTGSHLIPTYHERKKK